MTSEEGVEKREPSYIVGGNLNWCSHYGKQADEKTLTIANY